MKWVPLLVGSVLWAEAPLKLERTIALPHVEGRIDHLAADIEGHRLFVAALGNNSVEVLDVQAGRHLGSLKGLKEPQGVAWVPDRHRLYVANGGDGALRAFGGEPLALAGETALGDDADNVRYDASEKLLWVGYGDGALGVFDPGAQKRIAEVALEKHPESFQLEKNGSRLFVNVPRASHVAVIDRAKRQVVARWPVTEARQNYPMTLDEANHRLFIGCRTPARLLVLDTNSGKVVASAACVGDTDDLFYDAARRRVYIAGGAGSITIIEQRSADRYEPVATIPTASGARTALFVPEWRRLFLAVPHRGAQQAEIRVYATE